MSGFAGIVTDSATNVMNVPGSPGAGVADAADSIVPVVPNEVVLPIAGFAAGRGELNLFAVIVWTTVGSVAGSLVVYAVGALLGRARVRALAVRVPLVTAHDVDRSEAWFARHGPRTVLFGRMLPVFRVLISIPAGVQRMPVHRFAGRHRGPGLARWPRPDGRLRPLAPRQLLRPRIAGGLPAAGRLPGRTLAHRPARRRLGPAGRLRRRHHRARAVVLVARPRRGRPRTPAVDHRLSGGGRAGARVRGGAGHPRRDAPGAPAGLAAARPGPREAYERRISELAESRAATVAAVDEERRRIERDLHDGVQQRLVAIGMLLGRARRATRPETADDLVQQAHTESRQALSELREVAWRVYPAVLDSGGLPAALETVAERSALPVDMTLDVEGLDRAVEAAVYFVVCEAVTNAIKHSGGGAIAVRATRAGSRVVVEVRDDGTGGADPAGGGLTGLARRVSALDGTFRVDSPPGGPTVIVAEVPCG